MKRQSYKAAHVPVYRRIERELRERVSAGVWKVDEAIPARRALADEFGVGLPTLEQAISLLLADGVLRADGRRGTYVTSGGAKGENQSAHGPEGEPGRGPIRITVVAGVHPGHFRAHPERSGEATLIAIERACGQLGASVSYCKRQLDGDDWEPIAQTVARIDCSKTDAVIVAGLAKSVETPVDFVTATESVTVPLVCLSAGELPAAIPHVFYDSRYGGYQAALHLLDKGHDQLMFLSPFRASWTWDRLTGVRQALTQRRLGDAALQVWPAPESVPSSDEMGFMSFERGREMSYRHARERLAMGEPCRAIVAVSDSVAIGYMNAAKELGLEAGRDYSIVGFDNSEEARELELTTLQRPWEAMANEAVSLAFALAQGRYTATQVRMRPHLVPRASTALASWQLRGDEQHVRI